MLKQDEIEHWQEISQEGGIPAVYRNKSGVEFGLTVIPVKPIPGRLSFGEYVLHDTSLVFLVDKQDFLDKNSKNPSENDFITVNITGNEEKYIVDAIGGAPTWLDSGNYGIIMRICTKQYRTR